MNYIFAIVLVIFEIVFGLIVAQIKNVGPRRSVAITGWIALFLGISFLINAGIVGHSQLSFYFLSFAGAVALLAILLIFLSVGKPNVYLGFLRKLFTVIVRIGWFIGVIMPLILVFLEYSSGRNLKYSNLPSDQSTVPPDQVTLYISFRPKIFRNLFFQFI